MPISLGSSLLAKTTPGSKTRDVAEANIQNPFLPDKGQIGSVSRQQVEQPLDRSVPQGSNKVVGIQPTIEGAQVDPSQASILPGSVGLDLNMPLRSGNPNPGATPTVAQIQASLPNFAAAYAPKTPLASTAPGGGGNNQLQNNQPSNNRPSAPSQPQAAKQPVKVALPPVLKSVLGASTANKVGTKSIVQNLRSKQPARFIA